MLDGSIALREKKDEDSTKGDLSRSRTEQGRGKREVEMVQKERKGWGEG